MISPRRAALLGLTVPLRPVVVAVLGLWPEDAEPPLPDYRPAGGATRVGPRALARPRPAWRPSVPLLPREPLEEDEALLLCGALG